MVAAVRSEPDPLEQLRAALAAQARKLTAFATDRGAWEDDGLRRFRVAVRRLRSQLRAGRPLLDDGWARVLRAELEWLGRAAGQARELDVLLRDLRSAAIHFEPGERFLIGRPLQQLERERETARAAFAETLVSERCIVLLDGLEDGVASAPAGTGPAMSLSAIATTEYRRLRKRARRLGVEAGDDDLHSLRLDVKRARYAAELAGVEAGKPAARFVDRARTLQDVLGAHHDASIAEARLRRMMGAARGARWATPGGRLVEHEYARRQAARAAWPAAWWQLEKAGRAAWGSK